MEDDKGNAIIDRNGEPKRKTLNPCLELSYTYLATWYVMHCPVLMSTVQKPIEDFVPFTQKLERSRWHGGYMAAIRRIVQSNMTYHLFRCFPNFLGGDLL